jgi:hypothetical protein
MSVSLNSRHESIQTARRARGTVTGLNTHFLPFQIHVCLKHLVQRQAVDRRRPMHSSYAAMTVVLMLQLVCLPLLVSTRASPLAWWIQWNSVDQHYDYKD